MIEHTHTPTKETHHDSAKTAMKSMSINRLLLMVGIHFVLMYILMYAMVDQVNHIFPNLNQIYMAGVMTTPMLILEVILMGSMYEDKRMLKIITGISVVAFIAFFLFIRQQVGITNGEFLRSMIPHHAGAILMCEQAPIEDSEIVELCENIITSQQAEIEQMRAILDRVE